MTFYITHHTYIIYYLCIEYIFCAGIREFSKQYKNGTLLIEIPGFKVDISLQGLKIWRWLSQHFPVLIQSQYHRQYAALDNVQFSFETFFRIFNNYIINNLPNTLEKDILYIDTYIIHFIY